MVCPKGSQTMHVALPEATSKITEELQKWFSNLKVKSQGQMSLKSNQF